MNILSPTFKSLEQAMAASALKQKVHSSNIANVDTPNYKSKQVDFQATLNGVLNNQPLASYKTDPKHISFGNSSSQSNPSIKVNNSTTYNTNGSNVDMDVEMAELAENQLWYNALTERVNGNLNSLRTVINGGR
ncbi:flagellar basal body rod protein FlgB [Planomicrobium sp. CPCC 101079]|uniref:flagellar basal body rod protein FlgB n=1 Tax=Planomicrobium sp. CPCC 101079 TaxID=2599618 RepID=UPI0011B4F017|nr:flagellar basal body rod protein FlgB [Planomicrobium sp. CPCC 101079]TWT03688.1 flagellar basal body rod protein FlgB [Planomicrobium sp. CPCC 101079]